MCSDSNLYGHFVRASERLSSELFKKRKSQHDVQGTLSGYEAREFYNSVLTSTSNDNSSCTDGNGGMDSQTRERLECRTREVKRSKRRRHFVCDESHSSVSSSVSSSDSTTITTSSVSAENKSSKPPVNTKTKSQEVDSGIEIRLVNKYLQEAQNGNLKEIETLLRDGKGVDINACDQFGWTALMCAAYSGHTDVARYLLCKGALWKGLVNSQGQTALHLAKLAKHDTVITLLESWVSCSGARATRRRCVNKHSPFWCSVCQQEFTEDQMKHQSSTVHQFNCQHKPKEVYFSIPENNRGYRLMVRSGWDDEKGLGPEGEGRKYPIKTVLKRDRYGLGSSKSSKARVTHFGPHDDSAVKRQTITKKNERKESLRTLSKKQKRKKESKEKAWERNMRLYMNT